MMTDHPYIDNNNEAYLVPPPYEPPPKWIPPEMRTHHPDFCSDIHYFLPRSVTLSRLKASDALGFNIRGGKEHNFGLYVSKVMPSSAAANLGVKEGDQILEVNGIDFSTLDHSEAVKVLKVNTHVQMVVRYFPYGYQRTYDRHRTELNSPGPTSSPPPTHSPLTQHMAPGLTNTSTPTHHTHGSEFMSPGLTSSSTPTHHTPQSHHTSGHYNSLPMPPSPTHSHPSETQYGQHSNRQYGPSSDTQYESSPGQYGSQTGQYAPQSGQYGSQSGQYGPQSGHPSGHW